MDTKELDKLEQEMLSCIRCGYCFEFCPTFREEGWESASSRGRMMMAYGMSHGELEPSKAIAHRFFQCTTCRDCMNRCSAGVQIRDIIEAARADLIRAGFSNEAQRALLKNVLDKGNIFGDEEVAFPLQEGETPVFLGCNYLARTNQVKRWMKIFSKVGLKPRTVDEICCGFPIKVIGFYDHFEEYKQRFRKAFPFDEAVCFCPSCTMFLKEEFGIKTKSVLTAMLSALEPAKKLDLKITYHDPCDLGRGLGVYDDPRNLLKKLGAEVVEMKFSGKNSRCCGGGGGILVTDTVLSQKMANSRVHEAIDTGADLLVTACATCENTLKQAATEVKKQGERTIKVRDISSLIWDALK